MFNTKVRTTIIALAASASFAVVAVAPAVSQAQWHTYCVSGHCITHSNYTVGGVEPCTGINSNYSKAYETLLEAIQTKQEQANMVHPEMTQAEAQAKIEEDEAQVHLAEVAAFEWGCTLALRTSPTSATSGVVAPVGAVQSPQEGSTVSPLRTTSTTLSPASAL